MEPKNWQLAGPPRTITERASTPSSDSWTHSPANASLSYAEQVPSAHFPVAPGSYALKVRLFKPVSSSLLQQFLGRLMGMPPEFVDPKLPSRGDGREVTRVESTGHVIVKVNIMTKDMDRLGYETAGPQTSRDLVVVQT